MAKKRKRRRGAGAIGRLIGFLAASVMCGVLAASLVVPAVAAAGFGVSTSIGFFESLPAELKVQPPSQATKVLTSDGQLIATFYAENRVRVPLDQMSPF
ncbi:MAG: penicillin-binding protein, partial [Pseudarthrobacter sp.]|nr:penicillin-binding protein [Pseudarthrobacter sp.]